MNEPARPVAPGEGSRRGRRDSASPEGAGA